MPDFSHPPSSIDGGDLKCEKPSLGEEEGKKKKKGDTFQVISCAVV